MDRGILDETFVVTGGTAGLVSGGRRRATPVWAVLTLLGVPLCHQAQAATVTREITIENTPAAVWDAVRDVGAVDRRLAAGLVVSDHLEGGIRTVTFANGKVVREVIISIDDQTRRVTFAPVGGAATHQNSSMQVFASGEGSRLVWITDILPDSLAGSVADSVKNIVTVIKTTLERKQ